MGTATGGGALENATVSEGHGLEVPTRSEEFMANNEKITAAGIARRYVRTPSTRPAAPGVRDRQQQVADAGFVSKDFQSPCSTNYHLVFMDILLITIPPLIAYRIFQRQIMAGMTAGSV